MRPIFTAITIILACAAIATTVVIPVLVLAAEHKNRGEEET